MSNNLEQEIVRDLNIINGLGRIVFNPYYNSTVFSCLLTQEKIEDPAFIHRMLKRFAEEYMTRH